MPFLIGVNKQYQRRESAHISSIDIKSILQRPQLCAHIDYIFPWPDMATEQKSNITKYFMWWKQITHLLFPWLWQASIALYK